MQFVYTLDQYQPPLSENITHLHQINTAPSTLSPPNTDPKTRRPQSHRSSKPQICSMSTCCPSNSERYVQRIQWETFTPRILDSFFNLTRYTIGRSSNLRNSSSSLPLAFLPSSSSSVPQEDEEEEEEGCCRRRPLSNLLTATATASPSFLARTAGSPSPVTAQLGPAAILDLYHQFGGREEEGEGRTAVKGLKQDRAMRSV